MASKSYNPDGKVEEYTYPYPSNLCATNFISVKLSGKENYHMWEAQMRCLLQSHGMLDFIKEKFSCYNTPESNDESYRQWTRSDAVVKGWILGSLSQQTLDYALSSLREKPHVHCRDDFHARCLWNELQIIYNPQRTRQDLPDSTQEVVGEVYQPLRQAILAKDLNEIDRLLDEEHVSVITSVTSDGNTMLHLAITTTMKLEVIEKLLEKIPGDILLSDLRNRDGSTPLHVAAIVGNIKAAQLLVRREPTMLFATDYNHQTPLSIAVYNTDRIMLFVLQSGLKEINNDQFSDKTDDEILAALISFEDYFFPQTLLTHTKTVLNTDLVLMALAQNFPNELSLFQKCIVFYVKGIRKIEARVSDVVESAEDMVEECVPSSVSWMKIIPTLFIAGIYYIIMLFPIILKRLVWPFINNHSCRSHDEAKELLVKVCEHIKASVESPRHNDFYKNPLFEATRQNSYEVVEVIKNCFPSAILCTNEDDHNIIQYAVINRSEMVYNLVYEMGFRGNAYRSIKDSYKNNLLHLAGILAPTNKLELISGEFLQIQSELQWFKEVKQFVSPLCVKEKNFFGETPQMVFTREHKELVIEGEKWLKATAESYTITAALITTIVFAAAITVPGGNNQDTGIPVFTNNNAFTVFAISDAISLFAAVTSLLMFLSILTARFAEKDFLYKLPTKLIIALVTLFISTTSMIIAAGATLYLVFGQSNSKILVTIVVSTCLPIVAFVTLQSRLITDLMSATYGRSIFGNKRDRLFYFTRGGGLNKGENW